MTKNDFKVAGVRHLEFKKNKFSHVTVIEIQVCLCVPKSKSDDFSLPI